MTTDGPLPAPPDSALLQVTGLTLQFGGVTALHDIDFDVQPAELLAVIGPNGAGKTSIFNCINGINRPVAGSICLDGVELVGKPPAQIAARGVARTFQNLGLFDTLDVIDNLLLGRDHLMRGGFVAAATWFGRARREEKTHRLRAEAIAETFRLSEYRGIPVGVLPYGTRKKIEIARAVAMDPRLLLLDEPVAGMNTDESREVATDIVEFKRNTGISVILVEHDMSLVMGIADRALVLDFGVRLSLGTPRAVQQDDRVVDAYLGRSTTDARGNAPTLQAP